MFYAKQKLCMKDKLCIFHPYHNTFHTLSFFQYPSGFQVSDVFNFIRDTFPEMEATILYHICPRVFVHLPTVRMIHYRFLDFTKLEGVIYKKSDLMTFFEEILHAFCDCKEWSSKLHFRWKITFFDMYTIVDHWSTTFFIQ